MGFTFAISAFVICINALFLCSIILGFLIFYEISLVTIKKILELQKNIKKLKENRNE